MPPQHLRHCPVGVQLGHQNDKSAGQSVRFWPAQYLPVQPGTGRGCAVLALSGRCLGRRRSDGQALAAFGATCVDDGAAATGFHANQESVGACTADFRRLVSAFHGQSPSDKYPHCLGESLTLSQILAVTTIAPRPRAPGAALARAPNRPPRRKNSLAPGPNPVTIAPPPDTPGFCG